MMNKDFYFISHENNAKIFDNIEKIRSKSCTKVKGADDFIFKLKYNELGLKIDNYKFQMELLGTELNNYENRLKALSKLNDIIIGIVCSIIVAIISVIIPFFIYSFQDFFDFNDMLVFKYLIFSFLFSMFFLLWYLVYSYCQKKIIIFIFLIIGVVVISIAIFLSGCYFKLY